MPFTPRKIDWRLLVDPTMRGLALEADADARMNQNIMSGLLSVGQGVQRGAANRESKRRFGIEAGLRERSLEVSEGGLKLRQDEAEAKAAERLAFQEYIDEELGGPAAKLVQGQQLSPQEETRTQGLVKARGGPEAAIDGQIKLVEKGIRRQAGGT